MSRFGGSNKYQIRTKNLDPNISKQPDRPTRPEAIRRLMEKALEAKK